MMVESIAVVAERLINRSILQSRAGDCVIVLNFWREYAGLDPITIGEFIDEVCEKNDRLRETMKGGPDGD